MPELSPITDTCAAGTSIQRTPPALIDCISPTIYATHIQLVSIDWKLIVTSLSANFSVTSQGGTTFFPNNILATYPLVQIQGNRRLVLEYYPKSINADGHYHVRSVHFIEFIELTWYWNCNRLTGGLQVARAPLAGEKQPTRGGHPRNDDGGAAARPARPHPGHRLDGLQQGAAVAGQSRCGDPRGHHRQLGVTGARPRHRSVSVSGQLRRHLVSGSQHRILAAFQIRLHHIDHHHRPGRSGPALSLQRPLRDLPQGDRLLHGKCCHLSAATVTIISIWSSNQGIVVAGL